MTWYKFFKDAYRTGLDTEQLLSMSMWQYNAWRDAYKVRVNDELSLQVQAAYLGAYWNGAQKHKKSLQTILKSIQEKDKSKITKRKSINVREVDEKFRQFEEIRKYGRTKISN